MLVIFMLTWKRSFGTADSFKALASFLFSTAAGVVPDPIGGKRVPPRPVVVDLEQV